MVMDIQAELIDKYGAAAPRYTSYPPANHFHENTALLPSLQQFFKQPDNLVLPYSLYLHFPYCTELCYFCGCNMEINHSGNKVSRYVDWLLKDIEAWAKLIGQRVPVCEIHFGGGSPSDLSEVQMQRILDTLKRHFAWQNDLKLSIEIDPRHVTQAAQAERWIQQGFNRISLGLQDFDPQVQKAVNRIQPKDQTFQTYRWFKVRGIASINVDLIYGLPHQSAKTFANTLEQVLELSPDRIALFQFAYLPKLKKHHKLIDEAAMPSAAVRLELFNMALRTLLQHGYEYLGMDHFAKHTDSLAVAAREKRMGRNFQGYHEGLSEHMIGFGISSIGVLGHLYFQNTKGVAYYEQKLAVGDLPIERGYVMSKDDLLRRHIIERMMCDFALDFEAVEKQYGISFNDYFATELSELIQMQDDGLLFLTFEGLQVSPQGKHFIRFICKCFDVYARAGKLSVHHMKTV